MRAFFETIFYFVFWVPPTLFFPLWWRIVEAESRSNEMAGMSWILGFAISVVFLLPISSFIGSIGYGLTKGARERGAPSTMLGVFTAVALSPWLAFVGTALWLMLR